ncbi:uncharacterized protein LOC135833868 isoform X2 [Planococcus citri]
MEGSRLMLAPNAIPTIFKHTSSLKTSRKPAAEKMKNEKKQNDEGNGATSEIDGLLKEADCSLEERKHAAHKELISALYEDANPLDDDVMEPNIRNTNQKSLGLENIPMSGNDISSESNIEFSYSTPKKLNDLTPILAKWSPKMSNVVSIVDNLVESSDDEDGRKIIENLGDGSVDEDSRSDEETDTNHVVYINEDLVKQERFEDENAEENFDYESTRSSKKDKDELGSPFDENKPKEEYHISDTLCVKIPKINMNGTSVHNYRVHLPPERRTRNGIIDRKSSSPAQRKSTLPKKSAPKKPSKDSKPLQNNQRCKETPSSVKSRRTVSAVSKPHSKPPQNNQRCKETHSDVIPRRTISTEPKPQSKIRNNERLSPQSKIRCNKRLSLRTSGKSPEVKVPDYEPLVTRSGKKRLFEESKDKSIGAPPVYTIDDAETSRRTSKTSIKKEPEVDEIPRPHSPPPSAYRKNIEVLFVCQCCDKKYASVEHVKAHIRTHFPNCATN